MAKYSVEDIRNIALVGHGAVGKTTLADLMLFKAGIGSRAGSVDDGSSVLDVDDEEKDRKSSISSSVIHFDHSGKHINVVDTPGFPDFIGQVYGALRAVETAVITINAGHGIEVNTRRTFNLAGKADLARVVLVNKCDVDNIDFDGLLSAITELFGQGCVPLNLPIGLGADFKGVISTLTIPESVPDGVPTDIAEVNQTLMDAIVKADEELMERYLEGESLSKEEIAAGLSKALAAGTFIPILFASAKNDVGVSEFMDTLADIALAPNQVERTVLKAGEETPLEVSADGSLLAQVFKTRIDPFVAKMSYLRVYSGTLHKDQSVHSSQLSKNLKLHQLLKVQGGSQDQVEEAVAGDIVAVVKMEDLHTGNSISDNGSEMSLPAIPFPKPMIGLAVEPKSRADQTKISSALHKIEEEDATFTVYRDPQTHEMVMQGMSELHLQIVQDRLHRREKVDVITHQPKVPYRETVNGDAEGSYRHKKQSGGSGQFAEVHMRISHLPQDVNPEEYFTKERFVSMRSYNYDPETNFAFVDRITGGSIPNQFIPAVEKGVKERMVQGVIAGYQVQDCACELFFGKDHPVDSNETAFKTAGSHCFKQIFAQAKPTLLEPIVNIEITVPDDKLGDITSDLNGRRGRVEGMDGIPGGFQVIHAKAPLAEVMTYARSLSSMTAGQGSFTLELSHYEMVPPNEQKKIIEESKKQDEDEDS